MKVSSHSVLARWLVGGALFAVMALACAGIPAAPDKRHPTGQELVDVFYTHQEEFKTLHLMALEDEGLEWVSPVHTLPEDPEPLGITPQRVAEYRALFQELGLEKGVYSFDDKTSLTFIASELSWVKGYLYADRCPGTLVEDIDQAWNEYSTSETTSYAFCQLIEGNWYLFLSSGD
ncbi:MAG: hypothetical protein RBT47_03150 [Anaerolineae bacterium]|nr:hypothetical protein [Anaerolineae bacterium]